MLLAMDSSTRAIGLALYDGVSVQYEAIWNGRNHHTVELAAGIRVALEKAGIKIEDLEALAVATGPGSYNGLRIGLAVAKGLAFAQKLPLIGIPTLDVIAAAQPIQNLQLAAAVEAGRGRLAVGWYEVQDGAWRAKGGSEVLTLDAFAKKLRQPTWVCGELSEEARKILGRKRKNVLLASPAQGLRRPGVLAELAWARWQAGDTDDAATLAPHYLNPSEDIPG